MSQSKIENSALGLEDFNANLPNLLTEIVNLLISLIVDQQKFQFYKCFIKERNLRIVICHNFEDRQTLEIIKNKCNFIYNQNTNRMYSVKYAETEDCFINNDIRFEYRNVVIFNLKLSYFIYNNKTHFLINGKDRPIFSFLFQRNSS